MISEYMHKKIIFSLLLIINTATHGMKRPNIFQNDDIDSTAMVVFTHDDLLPQITAHLYKSHNYQPCNIREDIRGLSNTNKFFHNYYAQDKVKKELIDLCVLHNNSNHRTIARNLGCRKIYTTIKKLTKIVRNKDLQFSEKDLKDPWYLNITTTYNKKTSHDEQYNGFQYDTPQSLLYIAIDHWNLKAAIAILDHAEKLHFQYGEHQNPLLLVTKFHELAGSDDILLREQDCDQFLTIAQKLLEKGMLPDGRKDDCQYTPLICAVSLHDKKLTQLLIEHNANPYLKNMIFFQEK